MKELKDREERQDNFIIFNAPEPNTNLKEVRICEDTELVKGKTKGTHVWGTRRLEVLVLLVLLVQPLISYEFSKLLICRRRHKFTRQSKMANMREICVVYSPIRSQSATGTTLNDDVNWSL